MARDSKEKRYDDGKTYWLKGRSLNAIWAAIHANKPLAGKGTSISQKHDGTEIHAVEMPPEEILVPVIFLSVDPLADPYALDTVVTFELAPSWSEPAYIQWFWNGGPALGENSTTFVKTLSLSALQFIDDDDLGYAFVAVAVGNAAGLAAEGGILKVSTT